MDSLTCNYPYAFATSADELHMRDTLKSIRISIRNCSLPPMIEQANKEKGSMDERRRKRRRIGVRLTARVRRTERGERGGRENDRSTRSATCLFRGPCRGLVKPVCTRRRVADTPSFTWIIRDTRYIAAKSRTHFPNQRAFASL